jgi:hypothetical protein
MKTFQQFNEDAQVGPSSFGGDNSREFQKNQMKGLTRGLEKVRTLPGEMKDAAQAAKDEAEAEKEKEELKKEKEEDRKERVELRRANEKRKQELHQAQLIKLKQQTNEVYDADVMSRSQIRKTGEGGRVGRDRRKSEPERRRMKAVGGGKTAPVSYNKHPLEFNNQQKNVVLKKSNNHMLIRLRQKERPQHWQDARPNQVVERYRKPPHLLKTLRNKHPNF